MQNNWKQLLIASTCFFIITQNSLSEAAEQQWLSASGKCRLQFVSTNYTCTSVVYGFGSGRTLFSVLADPGTSLQISFSGGVDRNVPPDIYELVVDRLVMSSTSSPKKMVYQFQIIFRCQARAEPTCPKQSHFRRSNVGYPIKPANKLPLPLSQIIAL